MLDMVKDKLCAICVRNRDSSVNGNNKNGVNKILWEIFRAAPDLVRDC